MRNSFGIPLERSIADRGIYSGRSFGFFKSSVDSGIDSVIQSPLDTQNATFGPGQGGEDLSVHRGQTLSYGGLKAEAHELERHSHPV